MQTDYKFFKNWNFGKNGWVSMLRGKKIDINHRPKNLGNLISLDLKKGLLNDQHRDLSKKMWHSRGGGEGDKASHNDFFYFWNIVYTHWHVSTVVYKWWHLADCKLLQFIKKQKFHFVNKGTRVTIFLAEKQQMTLIVCHSV